MFQQERERASATRRSPRHRDRPDLHILAGPCLPGTFCRVLAEKNGAVRRGFLRPRSRPIMGAYVTGTGDTSGVRAPEGVDVGYPHPLSSDLTLLRLAGWWAGAPARSSRACRRQRELERHPRAVIRRGPQPPAVVLAERAARRHLPR